MLVSIPSELGRNEELLDVETLSLLSSWTQERTSKEASSNGIISISDHWAVSRCGGPSELCLRRSGEDWQPFHPIGFDTHMIEHQRIPSSFVRPPLQPPIPPVIVDGGIRVLATCCGSEMCGYPCVRSRRKGFSRLPYTSQDYDPTEIVAHRAPVGSHLLILILEHGYYDRSTDLGQNVSPAQIGI